MAVVDNQSVLHAVYSTKFVEDKRLRIDTGYVKELLASGEIDRVCWVPGGEMIADILTKKGVASFNMLELLPRGKLVREYW